MGAAARTGAAKPRLPSSAKQKSGTDVRIAGTTTTLPVCAKARRVCAARSRTGLVFLGSFLERVILFQRAGKGPVIMRSMMRKSSVASGAMVFSLCLSLIAGIGCGSSASASRGGTEAARGGTCSEIQAGGGSVAGQSTSTCGTVSMSTGGSSGGDAGRPAAGGSGGTSAGTSGNAAGGSAGAATANGCDQPGLVWKSANKTNYTSYPEPGSDECVKFSGCMYEGLFAACDQKRSLEWVKSHNIVAAFPDLKTLELHDLCLKSGNKTIIVTVYDTCADDDCDGCCTQNKGNKDELIDIESFTDARWGVPDGAIQWADLGPTKGSGCN